MKKNIFQSLIVALLCTTALGLNACGSDEEKDMVKPDINNRGVTENPINCQVYQPGDTIYVCYHFEDDTELGNYNIEIHSNFDHHSHSTESNSDEAECQDIEPERQLPDTAWVFNQSYAIPQGLRSYVAQVKIPIPKEITLPSKDNPQQLVTRNTRLGDYHFMIRLTDRAGWQQLKAVAIKVGQ